MRRLPVSGWIGAFIVGATVLMALVSLVWTPYDPVHAMPYDRLLGSSPEHLMGTDRYGRDVFSRIMAGSQITLFVGLVAVGISALIGVPFGILAGMRRGLAETLIMRGADLMLAFPALLLAIISGAVFGPSTTTAMAAIGIAGIPGFARVARAGTLQVMTQDYIASARVSRVPGLIVAGRHVLPNIAGVVIVQASVAFALAIAILLNRGMKGLPLYRAVFYLPSLLGASVAIAILWRQIFAGDGLVNQFLSIFGIVGPSWISNPNYSLWTLIVLSVWQFGSPMIIFLAGLRQIPQDMYEAASLDGASKWRQFWKITLPLLTPVVFFNAIIQTIEAFKSFTPAFIISNGTGSPINSTLFYTLYLYNEAFSYFRMGYASALAWVLLLIIALFTAIAFWTSKYWVHYENERG